MYLGTARIDRRCGGRDGRVGYGVGVGIQPKIQYTPVKQFKKNNNCTVGVEGVAY